jgi:hypothetical protein
MRIAPVITLSPEQRTVLESQVRRAGRFRCAWWSALASCCSQRQAGRTRTLPASCP